ncbi:Pr6Pr family membrane protein [Xanthobacter sp. V3C-3]|uniref:Pr6Pr family membrane protein n=1 Tax=Xanthobacter lutulentifluminis TaxID=3119935 RepID=UPI00372833F8
MAGAAMGVWARRVAAVTAAVAWIALALQLAIVVEKMTAEGFPAAVWRFLGYFTVLTNLLVAVVATACAVRPEGRLAAGPARLTTVVSIVLVGIIYAALLRHVWNPAGWQLVADRMLHQATPLLFLGTWVLAGHGGLGLKDAGWALAPPLGYLAYALARGADDGWYAYWFLDPAKLGDGRFVLNTVLLAAVFGATALVFLGLDRLLAWRSGKGA